MRFVPAIVDALYSAVGVASAPFADMDTKYKNYLFTCTTDCFIKQAATAPTASAAAGNMAVRAGQTVLLDTRAGLKVAVIQATAGGHATLTPVAYVIT